MSEPDGRPRCAWVNPGNPLYVAYHDTEWAVPVHDDRALFEMLSLEGAQAGLSWETVLNKRAAYRRAFHDFDIPRVARLRDATLEKLVQDPALIRHRRKLYSVRDNARVILRLQKGYGSLDGFVWSFVDHVPHRNGWRHAAEVPAQTAASRAMSRALRQHGLSFVGPTICYAFMQAVGMVNDHTMDCFRYAGAGPGRRRSE